jgi:hypothetical protein
MQKTSKVRNVSKQKDTSEESVENEVALKEIERIRRNGFNPGDEPVNQLISIKGPERALVIMRFAARVDRSIAEVH